MTEQEMWHRSSAFFPFNPLNGKQIMSIIFPAFPNLYVLVEITFA